MTGRKKVRFVTCKRNCSDIHPIDEEDERMNEEAEE